MMKTRRIIHKMPMMNRITFSLSSWSCLTPLTLRGPGSYSSKDTLRLGLVNLQTERILTLCVSTQSPDPEMAETPRKTLLETSRRSQGTSHP
jgi:hypothetical protein